MGVGVPPTTAVISVGVRVAYVHAGAAHLQKGLVLSFPHVCPEPVLVK